MRDKLLKMIDKQGKLPPLPAMISRLQAMIEDPEVGINEVAKVIQTDPVLAGRLIQLANSVFCRSSAFYATKLTRALSRLGLKMAMDIAYSLEMSKMFSSDNGIIDQEQFWRHSLGLSVISSRLAEHLKGDRDVQSHAYLGGLMKNVGILVFSHLIPKEYGAFLKAVQGKISSNSAPTQQLQLIGIEKWEKHVFGITNAELGAAFIRRWWPVDQIVVDFMESRPDVLQPQLKQVVSLANVFLYIENVTDGVMTFPKGSSTQLQQKFQGLLTLSPEEYENLSEELEKAMLIFAE